MTNKPYRPDDYLVMCQRSSEKCYRSECVVEHKTGLLVKKHRANPIHPLDTPVKIHPEPKLRTSPMPEPTFLNPGDVTPENVG